MKKEPAMMRIAYGPKFKAIIDTSENLHVVLAAVPAHHKDDTKGYVAVAGASTAWVAYARVENSTLAEREQLGRDLLVLCEIRRDGGMEQSR